jgi:predicted NUDIX family NTP pyrophosphohydrolase
MAKQSAGILFYRIKDEETQFLIVHPGGPYWANKDLQVWTIPKGELNENEAPIDAAVREVIEETGIIPIGDKYQLTPVKQKSGKIVHAWAMYQDVDTSSIKSNTITIEWPPKSNKLLSFPEIDKAEWCEYSTACKKLIPEQIKFMDELINILNLKT